jgi:hypothetical protein
MFSLDQTFRLWHDLLVCYKNAGWQKQDERVVYADETSPWPAVQATFERSDGRHAMVVFCFFDRAGLPLEVPGQLDLFTAITDRLTKRFSMKSGELFREQTCYQVQAFIQSENPISAVQQTSLHKLLAEGRERLRTVGLERLRAEEE